MDAANRRPQLPALTYLDVDKAKREEEAYQSRIMGPPQNLPPVTAASPALSYPPGPPPPYSQPISHQHAVAWPPTSHTPTDSPRANGDGPHNTKQTTQMARQSLPSLSEALGVDTQTSYPTSTAGHPPPQAAPTSHPQSGGPSSPAAPKRSYTMEPPQTAYSAYSPVTQPYSQYRQEASLHRTYAPPEPSRAAYPTSQDRPLLQVQTSQPSPAQPASSYSHSARVSPGQDHRPILTSISMGPPSFTYGYTPYPPKYAQPTPTANAAAGPIYQPSTHYAAPPTPSSTYKSESHPPRFGTDERANAHYGDSVKRQLDLYDFEAALNEIAQTCGHVSDFTRRYGDRMHQTARSGPTLATLPSMVEVDDMIAKSRSQVESLAKIRDVVLTQQAAYEQQAADQRQQHKALAEQSSPPEAHFDADEAKVGYAGSDTKKRRGRAAPPGRCHSCNRAETPEWRRGPDGARTLCNACGLHYAKLTRKQNGANKNAAAGGSTLRPKESAA